jgi:hypothetical protein
VGLCRPRLLFLAPLALHAQDTASAGQPGIDRRDFGDRGLARVDATVVALQTQVKRGEPRRASSAARRRLRVLSLVPMR